MKNNIVLEKIKGGLIVSCQALKDEPLYGSEIMAKMAFAAKEGGAVAIRANTPSDIKAIKKVVNLPVIGLHKVVYKDSEVYITPTEKEIIELIAVEPDIIAIDATDRIRPGGEKLDSLFKRVRKKYPDKIFMADCSCYEDGVHAEKLGFDIVGTTMRGYTETTKKISIPDYDMIYKMTTNLTIPVIAEGGIWETAQLQRVFQEGAFAAVIGTAITRPRDITKHFVQVISK